MRFLTQLRIGRRLALAFTAVLVAAASLVAFGVSRLASVTDSVLLIDQDRVPKLQQASDITAKVNTISREMRNLVILVEPAQRAAARADILAARDAIGKTLERLAPTITSAQGMALLEQVSAARRTYVPLQQQFMQLVDNQDLDGARLLLMREVQPAQLAYLKVLDALAAYQVELIQQSAQEGEASYQKGVWAMGGLLLAMVLLSAGLGVWITRSITQPLRQAVAVAECIAAGDLRSDIQAEGRDELAELLLAMQGMQQQLVSVVGTVRHNAESVATASAQIAVGNSDLSQRTEEQAASLQQTAATMDELSGTVTNNAANAQQANRLAESAAEVATRGGAVVATVVSTMQGINDSSRRIADIIGVIDGIAFQTNILALNAAVEAARAGEQGRGFAVVAGEVRTLAQRSAEAAKEIKGLISASVERVTQGSAQVNEAGHTMTEIVAAIQRVTNIVAEISHASGEQAGGIGQVGQAVSQMDQVTQQNAALVEQSAAAAESLKGQAQHLVQAVEAFRLP
jgi:methyl-accepting chemotaxis protein